MHNINKKMRIARLKLELSKALLIGCLVLVCGMHKVCGVEDVFMNSYKMCGEDANYPVTKDIVYRVKADVSPETATDTFRSCEMTFSAEGNTGRLCLVQDYPNIQIAAKTAKLEAFDGLNEENKIFSVAYSGYWDATEKCTQSRYITLFLSNGNSEVPVNINDIKINLRVMHISSGSRRIDMAFDTCEKTFELDHSEINVYNRQFPQAVRGREPIGLKSRCQVNIKRMSSPTRNICLVYVPQGEPDCGSDWTFYVLKDRNSIDPQNILYHVKCNDTNARKINAWCAANNTNQVTLLHWRRNRKLVWSNSTLLERPEQYRILVSDFEGGNVRELLRKTEAQLAGQSGSSSAGFSMWWVLLAVGVALVIIIAAFAYFGRRSRCGRSKRSRDSEATDRESSIARREDEEDEDEE